MTTELYNIDGMSCAACSSAVERVTRKLPGVQSSDVNLTTAKMTITYDEAQVTPEQIISTSPWDTWCRFPCRFRRSSTCTRIR